MTEQIDANGDTTVPTIALLIMQQMNRDAHYTWGALAKSFQRSYYEERARVQLIQEGVEEAYSHPWEPREAFVLSRLWPPQSSVKGRAAVLMKEDKVDLDEVGDDTTPATGPRA